MTDEHLAAVRAEETAIEQMEGASPGLRSVAREAFDGHGLPESVRGLREGVALSQAGWYLVIVLGLFVAVDQVVGFVLTEMGPEIRGAMGLSDSSYAMLTSSRSLAAIFVSMSMASNLHKRPRRRPLVLQAAVFTAGGAVVGALSGSFWPLFVSVALGGPTAGVVWALHRPMIMDGYLPEIRVRMMCIHQALVVAGSVAAPAILALLTGPFGLTWRGVLLVVGIGGAVLAVAGFRSADPTMGRHDTLAARAALRAALDSAESGDEPEVDLQFVETLRRLWLIPTVHRLLVAWAVVGIMLAPLLAYTTRLLIDRWGVSASGRGVFIAAASAFALPALAWFGRRGDRLMHAGPARLVLLSSRLLAVMAVGLLVMAAAPFLGLGLVGFGIVLAAGALLIPALMIPMLSVVPPETRAHAGAMVAGFLLLIGGQGGGLLLGGMDRRFGPAIAIATTALPALVAAMLLRRAGATIDDDLDVLLETVVEEEEVRAFGGRGERLPMLSCRNIDFAYGQIQVLFEVDFTVDEGEIVGLLGTNGAGKSTLLKCISGIGLPTGGTVRFQGADITYLDAERRVGMGITQIPGGRAVFGPMTVTENLRLFGYALARDRRAVDAGIDRSFDAFPRLAERRNQDAATLSGGEQQMLALSKALILRPRLLLIDELSLGLAPIIVGQLLDMVRQINADGTAVVLVEQSVNIALSLVDHAYFMEKGEMRFDGASADLLARTDLLRAVFLDGAAQAAVVPQ